MIWTGGTQRRNLVGVDIGRFSDVVLHDVHV